MSVFVNVIIPDCIIKMILFFALSYKYVMRHLLRFTLSEGCSKMLCQVKRLTLFSCIRKFCWIFFILTTPDLLETVKFGVFLKFNWSGN